ncbi:MAG: hypothetical protein J7L95_05900 [Prolixibacteraceae bacterium]|nr:hypothetical protein [Prolixibacteraceae bacterium]
MKAKNILCFGEVLWDKLPSGTYPGGALLNVAINLKKQGQNPWLVSKTGNDIEGRKLLRYLTSAGLNTDLVGKDTKLPTSEVLVHLDENKNASYDICEPVAWDNILPNREIEKAAVSADLIIFGSLASRNETTRKTLFRLLEKSKATRLLDVNLRPPYNKPEFVCENTVALFCITNRQKSRALGNIFQEN